MRAILRLVAAVATGCITLWVIVVLFEESLIFFPSSYPDGLWDSEALLRGRSLSLEDCYFTTEDDLELHGWWCRPASPGPGDRKIVLWFHGNAGNLSYRSDMMVRLAEIGVEVLIVDYRGYGRSQGKPSEEGLYRDASAAWRFLTVQRRVPAERIVLLGKSLGSAAAIDLATRVTPAGLIVQSAFTSVPDMARRYYPFVPRFVLRTRMDSLSKISAVNCPKLFVHSPADEVVPYEMGRRLFAAAAAPKTFYEVPDAGHNETYLVGGSAYFGAIRDFVGGL